MEDKIYFLAKEINEELTNHPDVILLNKLEKELNDSFEVYTLSNKKDDALEKYISNKEAYGENSPEAEKSMKELSSAKEELNNHPLVKQYLKAYADVRDLYLQINEVLFSNFAPNLCPKENK